MSSKCVFFETRFCYAAWTQTDLQLVASCLSFSAGIIGMRIYF